MISGDARPRLPLRQEVILPARIARGPQEFSGTGTGANNAMSKPVLIPARAEIWYSDGNHGFSVIRVTDGAWPFGKRKTF